jgi:ATP-dependent phosphoenolpyruvate carboxykinase
MTGSVKDWIEKNKLRKQFDAIYVSSRAAEVINFPNFDQLFKHSPSENTSITTTPGLLAVETAKFLVPFAKDKRAVVNTKIEEMAAAINMTRMSGM